MKNYLILALLSLASAVSAQAAIVSGATAGYLNDSKVGYYAGRIGYQFNSTGPAAHILELEVGYSSDTDLGVKVTLLPVTLNYRAEFSLADSWGAYVGAGIGEGRVKASYWWFHGTDWALVGQAFGGVSYKLTESTKLTLGARYVSFDSVKMNGASFRVGDDVAFEAGFSVKF